jgi:hypothetical protein
MSESLIHEHSGEFEWLTPLEKMVGKPIDLKDDRGKVHNLAPFGMREMAEIRKLGAGWLARALTLQLFPDEWFHLVWLSLRKEGLTRDEIHAREWKYTLEDAFDLFDGKDQSDSNNRITNAALHLLLTAGLIAPPDKKANPPKAAETEKTKT